MNALRTRGVVYMKLRKDGRKKLASLMIVQDVSHRELAKVAGWKSHGMVRHLLTGARTGVSPEAALAISKYLGVAVHDLFLTELSSVARHETHDARRAS